jgi:hypothetical protein
VAGKELKVRDPEFVSRYYARPARHDDWDEFRIQLLFTAAIGSVSRLAGGNVSFDVTAVTGELPIPAVAAENVYAPSRAVRAAAGRNGARSPDEGLSGACARSRPSRRSQRSMR